MNPHIRKTRNGKVDKRTRWNSRRVDQRRHMSSRYECNLSLPKTKQMHNMIPLRSSCCPFQLVWIIYCEVLHAVTFLDEACFNSLFFLFNEIDVNLFG